MKSFVQNLFNSSWSALFTFLHIDTLRFFIFSESPFIPACFLLLLSSVFECMWIPEKSVFFLKVSFWTIIKHKVKLIRELLFYITSQLNPSKKVILAVSKYQYKELGTECECCCWPWLPGAPACWACCPGLCALCGKNIPSPSQVLLLVSTQKEASFIFFFFVFAVRARGRVVC